MLTLAAAGPGLAQTAEQAQHRLPPVVYSLNIQGNVIYTGVDTIVTWSLMGYHDDYQVILQLYSDEGNLHQETYSPDRVTPGFYRWGDLRSQEFHFSATVNLDFTENHDITLRLFALPPGDPIDNQTFLSAIVPGGHPFRYGDSSGRKFSSTGWRTRFSTSSIERTTFSMSTQRCAETESPSSRPTSRNRSTTMHPRK